MGSHLELLATGGSVAPIHVLLVERHDAVRRFLRTLLDAEADIEVVAEAADMAAALDGLDRCRPDVLVVPLHSRAPASIEALRGLRARAQQAEIVVLSMDANAALAQLAIDAGASGFVLKERAGSDLASAVRRAARAQEYISAPLDQRPVTSSRGDSAEGPGRQ
jgi:DNA-binding NarL/FixJ family response regulator